MSGGVNADLALIAAALASPVRLRMLNLLFQGPKAVEALAALTGESRANTAAHLKTLRAAGLVTAVRDGKYSVQHVADDSVLHLVLALRRAGERLSPRLRALELASDPAASTVDFDELEALTKAREAVVVDLRPEPEYQLGHLPGARSLPIDRIDEGARQLADQGRILAYCRGKYCPNARRGVDQLRGAGLPAERLGFGVPEWRAAGHALEVGSRAGGGR